MRITPEIAIQKLITERYPQACAVFWLGSVTNGQRISHDIS